LPSSKKRRKILLEAARPVMAYVASAGIKDDKEGHHLVPY
jgi:hypothetical protein